MVVFLIDLFAISNVISSIAAYRLSHASALVRIMYTRAHAHTRINIIYNIVVHAHSNDLSNEHQMLCSLSMAGEIVPLSCALRFKPPTLVLLYKDLQTGTQ